MVRVVPEQRSAFQVSFTRRTWPGSDGATRPFHDPVTSKSAGEKRTSHPFRHWPLSLTMSSYAMNPPDH
jgi:hypothetical protein